MYVGNTKGIATLKWSTGKNRQRERGYIVEAKGLDVNPVETDEWVRVYKGKLAQCSISNIPLGKTVTCRVRAFNKTKQTGPWSDTVAFLLKKSASREKACKKTNRFVPKRAKENFGAHRKRVDNTQKSPEKQLLKPATDWVERWDSVSGHVYYTSKSTKQVTLELPDSQRFASP